MVLGSAHPKFGCRTESLLFRETSIERLKEGESLGQDGPKGQSPPVSDTSFQRAPHFETKDISLPIRAKRGVQ
jgi:hypothetical protein